MLGHMRDSEMKCEQVGVCRRLTIVNQVSSFADIIW